MNIHHIITIDGTSGVGKSTLARALSKEYQIPYLNSGAMFRSFAHMLVTEFPEKDYKDLTEEEIEKVLEKSTFSLSYESGETVLLHNNAPLTSNIYNETIAKITAHLASFANVRSHLRGMQQQIGRSTQLVAEGRDMGTVVFPYASIKFYLTALPEERAKRRYSELRENYPSILYENILEQLKARDHKDTHRSISPLMPAKDSCIVDTTPYSLDEAFLILKEHIDNRNLFQKK